MLTLYCTQAAAQALATTRKGEVQSPLRDEAPEGASQGWRWQLHVATINRRKVFMLMEQHSRFAVALWGISKGDVPTMLHQFWERVINHLLWLNEDVGHFNEADAEAALHRMLEQHRQVVFLHGSDRSVQQHLNQALADVRVAVGYDMPDLDDPLTASQLDDYLNRGIRRIGGKQWFTPSDEFYRNWLQQAAGLDAEALAAVAERQRELWWQRFLNRLENAPDLGL